MKTFNKLFAALMVGTFTFSCAEQDIENFYVEKPDGLEPIEALNAYGNIKDYLDRSKYPNFKIACALGADDYNKCGIVYRVANYNFDEITLGNAMKYASVVGDDGTMNFKTISDLLDNAEAAGMSVYGHTLAWHAQQNVTYLNSLLADAHVDIGPEDRILDYEIDFSDPKLDGTYPFSVVNGFMPSIVDGVLTATISNKKHQFYLSDEFATEPNTEYEIMVNIKGNKDANLIVYFGDKNNSYKIPVTTEWNVVKFRLPAKGETSYLYVDPGNIKLTVEIAFVNIGHYPPDSRPLTEQEKYDNLVGEINRWVSGMMEACAGRVMAWDLINEAIGGDGNVNGYYDLQHDNGSKSDFFWQDYLGNENYGPIVEKAARKAFEESGGNPADLKLFINDYNLESFWDNNKKLESLIYWVGVWEKNGAKIDGLSSQMHISFSENTEHQKVRADHVVKMLHRMADSGKLVRISELDMGYQDITAKSMFDDGLRTDDLNDQQLQNMANYYRFIIQMYLKIVPPAQQYSICQWCLTDAPSSSGWRPNEPVGLWTQDWQRKAAYAAFCEALQEPIPDTEDYFEYLKAAGLTHYISTPVAE